MKRRKELVALHIAVSLPTSEESSAELLKNPEILPIDSTRWHDRSLLLCVQSLSATSKVAVDTNKRADKHLKQEPQ
jgi:hypothetical protein